MRTVVAMAVVVALAAGCGRAAGDTPQGRVEVSVTAGPTCPVETTSTPCDPRPVERATLELRTASGELVARLSVRAGRAHAAGLDAGRYRLVPLPANGLMGTPGAIPFTIAGSGVTRLEVSYDTGIR